MRCFWMLAGLFPLFVTLPAAGQILEGVVTDDEGQPLADVHLTVESTRVSAISNPQGNFFIRLTDRESQTQTIPVLLATRVGYKPARVLPASEDGFESSRSDSSMPREKRPGTEPVAYTYRIEMQPVVYEPGTLVVTATRTQRDIEEVTIPVKVVPGDEIRKSGSMRLSDVLGEQTGMQLVSDHGSGIQVQGFDPDYTLIMIDGNPVIGRTAGTLDLTRVSVRNVEQIEIVKGPSSALWGSEALAGVVNIITSRETEPLSAGITTRYSRFNTLDLGADLSAGSTDWRNDFFINHNRSAGYSLNPNTISQTVPEYGKTTLSYRGSLVLSDRVELDAGVRYFNERQQNLLTSGGSSRPGSPPSGTLDEDRPQVFRSEEGQREFMANMSLSFNPADRLDLDLDFLTSSYHAGMDLIPTGNSGPGGGSGSGVGEGNAETSAGNAPAVIPEATDFKQQYYKPEIKAGYRWSIRHHSLGGTGAVFESLVSERYAGQPRFTTRFLFLQHTWNPYETLELTGGLRYDTHSEYSSQLSPKLSTRFKASERLQFRASVGRGFKAPDFRQLFLNFTNATEGYSVFGSSSLDDGMERLRREGSLSQILVPIDSIEKIGAESSRAVNAGFDLDIGRRNTERIFPLRLRVNLFRNHVDDLIETAPVARKTNGQSVFAYFNVDEAVMQGVEAELGWRPVQELDVSVGYQLLDARKRIERERTVQDSEGELIVRSEIAMKPLFNRSLHSGNIKLFYEGESGWGANLRGVMRGRYALFDTNGNNFADKSELEPGYMVWNAALTRQLPGNVTLQLGADNLFNYRNINQPWLAGRLWYIQASVRL